MSGSPKYVQVASAAARRAAEEAARRRAAERRARAEALRNDRARMHARRQAEHTQRSARERERRLAEQNRVAAIAVQQLRTRHAQRQAADARRALTREIAAADSRADTVLMLRARLAGVEDRDGSFVQESARCAALIAELEAIVDGDGGVRFESLVGSAEHAVGRLQRTAIVAAEERRAEERILTDARERLAEISPQAEVAAADAPDADLPELAVMLRAALEAARTAVAKGPGARAADLVAQLEVLTSQGEAQLDEAVILAERRAQLAEALKQAMISRGMYYQDGEKSVGKIVLRFTRANGATYHAQITDHAESGESLLTYTVGGEADITASGLVGVAECEQTESLLESVHAALAPHGFEAGETVWLGKPSAAGRPRRAAAKSVPPGATVTGETRGAKEGGA